MIQISEQPKKSSVGKQSLRQKRVRCKSCLEKKAREDSTMRGVDFCVGTRIRQPGGIFLYSAGGGGVFWSSLGSQWVSPGEIGRSQISRLFLRCYYPGPVEKHGIASRSDPFMPRAVLEDGARSAGEDQWNTEWLMHPRVIILLCV